MVCKKFKAESQIVRIDPWLAAMPTRHTGVGTHIPYSDIILFTTETPVDRFCHAGLVPVHGEVDAPSNHVSSRQAPVLHCL